MRLLLILCIVLTTINTQAALYKYTDENGEVVYSDKPPYEGAEELIPPKLQVMPAVKIKPKPEAAIEEKQIAQYTAFKITNPKNGATLRSNTGNISITLALEPKLNTRAGHYINVFINGVAVAKKTSRLKLTLNNLDRGTHSIQAELREKSGKLIIFSNNIIIHILRFSKQHKKPAR